MKYDIIIVGGGPAGTTAGINLIASGLRVLLVDQASFPRTKPCGGGISYRIYNRFPYLRQVFNSVPINFVDKVYLESPSGQVVETSDVEPLYLMVRRYEFDAALLQECLRGGIEVHQGSRITKVVVDDNGVSLTTADGELLESDLVIGADGVNSIVAIHSRLRQGWSADHVAIDTTEESKQSRLKIACKRTMYVYYGYENGFGYGYVFPKVEHVDFGVGYLLSYYKERVRTDPHGFHLGFLEFLNRSGVIQGESDRNNFLAYLIPVGGPLRRVSGDRVMLVGDSAGFVNGFTAEGIYYAMVSGEHAAKVAIESVRSKNYAVGFLRRYDRLCREEIGQELTTSVKIQKLLLSDTRRIDRIVEAARKNERLRRLLTDFAVGKVSYGEFRKLVVLRALRFYLLHRLESYLKGIRRVLGL